VVRTTSSWKLPPAAGVYPAAGMPPAGAGSPAFAVGPAGHIGVSGAAARVAPASAPAGVDNSDNPAAARGVARCRDRPRGGAVS
jgi:hypothetical protein